MKNDCNLLLLSDRQSRYVDHSANDGISKQLRYLYDTMLDIIFRMILFCT